MFDGLAPGLEPLFVGPHQWPTFAARVRPQIERMAAGSGGRFLAEDIEAAIASGNFQLWLVLDGPQILCAMTTQIIQYPRSRAMRCIGVVGHQARRWMPMLAAVESSARENFGCDRFEALHQPGHERLLRTGGWSTFHFLSEKAL